MAYPGYSVHNFIGRAEGIVPEVNKVNEVARRDVSAPVEHLAAFYSYNELRAGGLKCEDRRGGVAEGDGFVSTGRLFLETWVIKSVSSDLKPTDDPFATSTSNRSRRSLLLRKRIS